MGGALDTDVGPFSLVPADVGVADGDLGDSVFVAAPFTEVFLCPKVPPRLVGGVFLSIVGLWSGEAVSVLDSRFTIFFKDFMKPPPLDLTS